MLNLFLILIGVYLLYLVCNYIYNQKKIKTFKYKYNCKQAPIVLNLNDIYQEEDVKFVLDLNQEKFEEDIQQIILLDIQSNNKKGRDVHSSSIQSKLSKDNKDSVETISNDSFQQMLDYYNPDVHGIIKKIWERDIKMVLYSNKTEKDVLWSTFINGDSNVKDCLYLTLKDFDREGLKCSTGNVSRILECNYINNPEDTPVDEKTLNNMMLQRASILSRENTENIGDKIKNEFSEYGEATNRLVDSWGLD